MADTSLFTRLKRLFSTDVVLRNVGGDQLRLIDINAIQQTGRIETNSIIDRYNRAFTNSPTSLYGSLTNINYQTLRPTLYSEYDAMDTDAIIASALDIVADESTLKNSMGEVLQIRSSDEDIQRILYNLFYEILNIEFNLWPWIRNMCKYGDFFLKLEIADKLGVYNVIPYTAYNIERIEGYDPKNPSKVQFRYNPNGISPSLNYSYNPSNLKDSIIFDNYEVAHFRLLTDMNFLPYGRCLHPNTRITTDSSYKEIKDIVKGDKVWTFNIKENKYELAEVLNTINSGIKEIYNIRTTHNEIKASDNHPILVWDVNSNTSQYKQVKDLSIGDYVVHYDHSKKTENKIKLNKSLPEMGPHDWKTNQNPINTFPEHIDEEFARFWGFMLGDGYIGTNTHQVGFACGIDEQQNEYYKKLLLKYSGIETLNTSINENSQVNISGYYVNSKVFKHLMVLNGYTGKSYSKRFPEWIYKCDKNTQLAFVKGLMDADGYIFEDKWGCKSYNITLANKEMLEDLKYLLDINKIKTGFIRPRKYTGKCIVNNKEYNARQSYDFTFYLEGKEKSQPKKFNILNDNNNIELYKIKSITKELPEETYDIQVDKNSNFIANGIIVHNSYIEPARKLYKQYTMMEDSMLIHRIVRAPEKRLFYLNVGSIPPNEVDAFMEKTISKLKRTPYIDQQTGEYNLRYNIQNILEDYYIPVRGNDATTKIDTLNGLQWDGINDVNYLRDKLFAALKVPKAFMGYEEQMSGKATLAAQDIRFARTIERIQRIVVSELYKIAIVHLYTQGYRDENLSNFELSMTTPSIIYDQERVALMAEKTDLAIKMKDSGLFPSDFIYDHLFHLSEDQYDEYRDLVREDKKREFRLSQIEAEGNDPLLTGKSYGTPHDLASLYGSGRMYANPSNVPSKKETNKKLGRPEDKLSQRNSQKSNFGKDRLGTAGTKNDYNSNDKLKVDFKGGSPLALENNLGKYKDLLESIPLSKKVVLFEGEKNDNSLLDESNIKDQ
jgi:intein/homing endonuclease